MTNASKAPWIILGIVVLLVIIVITSVIGGYNKVVTMDEEVKGSWAQVENQLKRRYDLIPNLVETVKGFAKQEKGIFENIAMARTQYFQQKTVEAKIKSSQGLERALSRLLMLREQYPQLKSNENFMKLQDSLEGTENRIAVERKRYNDAVKTAQRLYSHFLWSILCRIRGSGKSGVLRATTRASRSAQSQIRLSLTSTGSSLFDCTSHCQDKDRNRLSIRVKVTPTRLHQP